MRIATALLTFCFLANAEDQPSKDDVLTICEYIVFDNDERLALAVLRVAEAIANSGLGPDGKMDGAFRKWAEVAANEAKVIE